MLKRKLILSNGLLFSLLIMSSCNNNSLLKSLNIKRVTDFVYEATLDYDYSYDDVREYFKKYKPKLACSAINIGSKLAHNLDYLYTNGTQYVTHTIKKDNRHASIGVSNLVELEDKTASDGKYHEEYKILPYLTVDGLNDAGISISINIVPFGQLGKWEMKTSDESDDIEELAIPRIILDNCSYLDEIVPMFDKIDFYSMGNEYEIHFIVVGPRSKDDKSITSAVFEFVPFSESNKSFTKVCCISNDDKNIALVNNDASRFYKINTTNLIMTNYNLWQFHPEYEDRKDVIDSCVGNPMGLERYEILKEASDRLIKDVGSKDKVTYLNMQDLMKKVNYSKTYDLYENNFWYTDYDVYPSKEELKGLTLEQRNPNGDLEKVYRGENDRVYNGIIKETNNWKARDRKTGKDTGIWETLYTAIYDYEEKSMQIVPHEGSIYYEYKL